MSVQQSLIRGSVSGSEPDLSSMSRYDAFVGQRKQKRKLPDMEVDVDSELQIYRQDMVSLLEKSLAELYKVQLLVQAHRQLKRIMEVANSMASHKFKLNANDRDATIGQAGQNLLAVVATLELRQAETEHLVTAIKLKCAQLKLQQASSCTSSPLLPPERPHLP